MRFLSEHPAVPGYEPVSCIGRNGSIVYLARREGSVESVALRVYNPGRRQADTQEALLASLNHPNILRIVELGEIENRVYAAIEYVEDTLAGKLRDGPLTTEQSVILARTIALTLDYLRTNSMVHPKLTPAAILLTPEVKPKLFDIQLMNIVEGWDKNRWFGSVQPAFSPPEALADENRLSLEGDVYRIGALLYTMLVGHPPFAGDHGEVVNAVLTRAPTPPRQLNAQISEQQQAVCLKCLAKEPGSRYESLQRLAVELGRV